MKDRERRDALRLNDYGAAIWAKQNAALYDYYVSSNLPGSTVLYGWLERISKGDPKVWRLAFAFGDVLIALAAYFLPGRASSSIRWASRSRSHWLPSTIRQIFNGA